MEFEDLSDWIFVVQEVSANIYKITATDVNGRNVEKIGLDPDQLLKEAKLDATQMTKGNV